MILLVYLRLFKRFWQKDSVAKIFAVITAFKQLRQATSAVNLKYPLVTLDLINKAQKIGNG